MRGPGDAIGAREHRIVGSDDNELAYIIYLADGIVNMSDALAGMDGMSADMDALMYMLDDKSMKFIGLKEADVKPIMEEITTKVGEMAGGF